MNHVTPLVTAVRNVTWAKMDCSVKPANGERELPNGLF